MVWNLVAAEIETFDPRDLMWNKDGEQVYESFVEYDPGRHPDPNATFIANYGHGLCRYRWSFCVVKIVNRKGGFVNELRYALAELCPSPDDMEVLFRPHCRCGYCTAPWLSWDWVMWKPKDYGCLKDGTGWHVLLRRTREKTRDYVVLKFGTAAV